MTGIINSGIFNTLFLLLLLIAPVLFLLLWFFINRASVRANEQTELLEALLEQQKQQTALLLRLCKANEPEIPAGETAHSYADEEFPIQLVAER